MRNMTLSLCAVLLLPLLLAGYEGAPIGGEPYEKWEDGGNGYFVMFNSLVDDQVTLYGEGENRQADTCILESSFKLNNIHAPDDAIISKAYLVWMAAIVPADLLTQTDNSVHLKFTHASSGYTYEEDIVAGDAPKTLGDTADPLLFQSVQFNTDITSGCTETLQGSSIPAEVAYFTYRTDITPFFDKIYDDNLAATNPLPDGEALYGTYTFSGLDCTDDDAYRCNGMMVSNWSVFFVYKSGKIRSRRIYLYPGLAFLKGEIMTATVSGFDLPKNPVVHLTSMVAGGENSTLFNQAYPLEEMFIRGSEAASTYRLVNKCNPYVEGRGYEVYNSNSSIITWDPDNDHVFCATGMAGGPDFPGIDVDTFMLDSEDDINLQEHLKKDMASLDISFSVNRDAILANYLILAHDQKGLGPSFDIPREATDWPNGREKHFCGYDFDEDVVCPDQPFSYLIMVQNWGVDPATDVVVIDDLPPEVDYVQGTTMMASQFDEEGDPLWTPIPDNPDGTCPLSGEGYKVAETMAECDQATWTCTDTRVISFKVQPKQGLQKYTVIENTATIKDGKLQWEYYTNQNWPLSLIMGDCPPFVHWVDSAPFSKWCLGECLGCTDDDTIAGADEDVFVPDEPLNDEEAEPDTDIVKLKDDGCSCSLMF